jgi:geranylgeranyl pyrophosphate synthase
MSISEDFYLKIAEMKSASQIECACYAGARLAGAKPELLDKFSRFGHNLGMAAQITNDIRGIVQGKDITNRKITLPVLYAISQTRGVIRDQLTVSFRKTSAPLSDTQISEIIFNTGAVHYSTIRMEGYRQESRSALSELENSGVITEHLKVFLE